MTPTLDLTVRAAACLRAWTAHLGHQLRSDDRGEGVISMSIAVLIVAFLGVAAWLAFRGLLDNTKDKVDAQLGRVGA